MLCYLLEATEMIQVRLNRIRDNKGGPITTCELTRTIRVTGPSYSGVRPDICVEKY